MTDREFDKLLADSVKGFGHTYNSVPENIPEHEFSPGFDKKIKGLGKKKRNNMIVLRWAAGIAAVFVIGVAVLLATGRPGIEMMNSAAGSATAQDNAGSANTVQDNAAAPEQDFQADTDEVSGIDASSAKTIDYSNHISESVRNNAEAPAAENENKYSGEDIRSDEAWVISDNEVLLKGKPVSLKEADKDAVAGMMAEMMTNDALTDGITVVDEIKDSYLQNGIIIKMTDITASDGNLYDRVTLALDDGGGLVIGEGDNVYNCYAVRNPGELFAYLEKLIMDN